MATTKKASTKTTTNKTTTVKTEVKSDKEKALEQQIAAMMEVIKDLQAKVNANNTQPAVQPVIMTAPTTDVTLVYMSDSLGAIISNNTTLNCTRFGEEFVLPRSEFDAIVGKYRSWFDRGILAVSSKNIEVAAAKGLKTDKEYNVNAAILNKIGTMSLADLEALWNNTPEEAHRQSIVTHYKRKFIEGSEAGYRDRARIDLMNRLTNGAFNRESVEVSGTNLKIGQSNW